MAQRIINSEYDEYGKPSLGNSFIGAQAVVPNDGAELPNGYTKGIFIGGAGNVSAIMNDGSTVVFTGLVVGVVYYFSVKQINATATTATNIVALY
jgi:hypothetical protein